MQSQAANPVAEIKVPCLVYSRIVGYLTPTSQWNTGKQQEWKDRITFKQKGETDG